MEQVSCQIAIFIISFAKFFVNDLVVPAMGANCCKMFEAYYLKYYETTFRSKVCCD